MNRRILLVAILVVGTLTALSLAASSFAQRRAAPRSEAEKPSSKSSGSKAKRTQPNRAKNSPKAQDLVPQVTSITRVDLKSVKPTVFRGDLRQLPYVKDELKGERPEPKEPSADLIPTPETGQPDAALQEFQPAAPAPTPLSSFLGLDFANFGAGWPPDTNGDVGPNHYIQAVNSSIGIYDKATGTRLAAFTFNQFFSQSPTGTPCDNNNQGDPVVLYDALADRWIISDFAWSNYTSGAMYQCMAVSQTGDPVSGGWYFYPWQTATGGKIPDYPKLGVWPDGIYMSANNFSTTTGGFQNVQVWAFDRIAMESGTTAGVVSFALPASSGGASVFSLLPSNLRNNGNGLPAGTPNYFASIWGFANRARVWKFHVDYAVPANSTLTGPTDVTIATFAAGPSTAPEQTGNPLDTLSYRLMMQNQYQNVNGTESIWLTHTVGSGSPPPNRAQIRWYQLNVTGGTIVTAAPIQQGTWSPDASYRYMPSLALDKTGAMALGYTVSSSTMFPAIRYAGRLANDPLNTLGQSETSLIEGTGYQCCNFSDGSPNNRWGDYSTMTIDPDGCTFWYTNEYYNTQPATLAQDNWKTRIGSFKFSQCTPNAVGTLQGTVTDATTTNPINGALVAAGIYTLKTNASGFYRFTNLPTGTYTVNVTASGYANGSANNVVVSSGATTTRNFALNPPVITTNLVVSAATGTYGGTTTLTATLTQQGGAALSGKTITFTLNGSTFANNTATTNGSGVATLSNVSLTGINAGSYPSGVGASFAAGGGFSGSANTNSLTITKATPVITWSDPSPIQQGTPLSGTQLNATSPVAGTFSYTPPSGTVLPAGNNQALSVLFTPTNTVNYNTNSATVHINVTAISYTVTGSPGTVNPGGQLSVSWTAPAGSDPTDWIALAKVGTPDTSFVWWQFTGGATSGSFNLTAPSASGQYEFRYLLHNDFIRVATSNTVTVGVSGGGGTYTVVGSPATVNPGGQLSVSWTAPAGSDPTDWIALAKVGTPDTSFVWWQFTGGATSGSFNLTAPSTSGQYEFRYLLQNDFVRVATSNAVAVGISGGGTYTLTGSPGSVNPGGQLSVSWTAPAGSDPTDWIALSTVGAPDTSFVWWQYTGGAASGSFNLTAPSTPGQYEFRYLLHNDFIRVATSNPVTVGASGGGGTYTVVGSPSTVSPGGQLTVNWTAPAGSAPTDWISFSRVGTPDNSFVWWQYTGGATSGSFTLAAPSVSGQYEFRYLLQNDFVRVATSNTVTIP